MKKTPKKGKKIVKNIFFCFKQISKCDTCLHKFTKNPLNYYLLKVKKIHGDSVKNESARAKNLTPLPSLFRVKISFFVVLIFKVFL